MNNTLFNPTEQDEIAHLQTILERLDETIAYAARAALRHSSDLREIKEYLWENKDGMDHMEKNSVRQSVTRTAVTGEEVVRKRERLLKLKGSPYFGRVDFLAEAEAEHMNVYIGLHAFYDTGHNRILIHDWRAPVSGLFYDYETGKASYVSPQGETHGTILLKRQYRIRKGVLEFMLESALNIHDDVLQRELSRSSDARMQNIVATIQREQNAIIRDETSHTLIIQGAAGSGKTSVALHRIAYLLYRFKESVKAEEVLILSPNKVFSDYISDVLPELGEERIPELTPEEVAAILLQGRYSFQKAWTQSELLASGNDVALKERIVFKHSQEFISRLEAFAVHIENTCFTPADIFAGRYPVPAWFVEERFRAHHRLPVMKRHAEIVRDIASNVQLYYKQELTTEEKNGFHKAIGAMYSHTNLRQLYKSFYEWLGKAHLLKYTKGSAYEYADIFPIIYLKVLLEGITPVTDVKHLIVDEMQDYSPVMYAVLSKVYPCRKTILGDRYQSLNPAGGISAELIARLFPGAVTINLVRTYRSTAEIMAWAGAVLPAAQMDPVLRHGEEPDILAHSTAGEELSVIETLVKSHHASQYRSMVLIVKNQKQSDALFQWLNERKLQVGQLTHESLVHSRGVMVATPHLVKGLEFDHVIIPHCTPKNYHTPSDRHLLYIAATRAMHRLSITWSGMPSPLIPSPDV